MTLLSLGEVCLSGLRSLGGHSESENGDETGMHLLLIPAEEAYHDSLRSVRHLCQPLGWLYVTRYQLRVDSPRFLPTGQDHAGASSQSTRLCRDVEVITGSACDVVGEDTDEWPNHRADPDSRGGLFGGYATWGPMGWAGALIAT